MVAVDSSFGTEYDACPCADRCIHQQWQFGRRTPRLLGPAHWAVHSNIFSERHGKILKEHDLHVDDLQLKSADRINHHCRAHPHRLMLFVRGCLLMGWIRYTRVVPCSSARDHHAARSYRIFVCADVRDLRCTPYDISLCRDEAVESTLQFLSTSW